LSVTVSQLSSVQGVTNFFLRDLLIPSAISLVLLVAVVIILLRVRALAKFQVLRRKLLQCYPKRWLHDKFDLGQLNTSGATIAYPSIVLKNMLRLYHLLVLYYLPSKLKLVTLPDPAAIHSRYSDIRSQVEEYLDIFQTLEQRVWSLMLPWNWHSQDDNMLYLSERLTLVLAHLQLIINQMAVLGVELRPFGGDNTVSEDAFVAAVHREVEKLIERRKKLEREVEEMSCVSQSSNTA
jgi:hypothetical protein